jgi:Recombination endonuclease VII
MKRCSKCGEIKPRSEFYAAPGCIDGLRGDCKACHAARARDWYAKNRTTAIANVRRWQQENAEHVRQYRRRHNATRKREIRAGHLRRTFGMTLEDYDEMLLAQGGGCAICGLEPAEGVSFHVDHLEDLVRGVLCVRCNNALGQLQESAELAARALDYLDAGGFAPSGVYDLHDITIERARGLLRAAG